MVDTDRSVCAWSERKEDGTSAGTISHNLFEGESYNSSAQYEDLYDDFVLRGFMGWTNENGLSFANFLQMAFCR